MERIKIGLLAGLIAVTVTTVINIIGRLLGIFPEPADLKYMAEWIIDPAQAPFAAFVLGVLIHLISGAVIGVIYALLLRKHWSPITGVLFMVLSWLLMMLMLFPLTGRGLFGLKVAPLMPYVTFMLSMIYGVILGIVARKMRVGKKI